MTSADQPEPCQWCIDLSAGVHYDKCPEKRKPEELKGRRMTEDEAAAVLVLVRGGWLKLELTL